MVLYRLSYVDDNGRRRSKMVELSDESQLQPFLRAIDLNISKIEPLPSYRRFININRLSGGINKKQVAEVLENLQAAAASGLTLTTVFLDMAKSADSRIMGDMLADISYRMQMSMSLSEAMSKYDKVFDNTVLGLVRIGEETGELDKTLKGAVKYISRIDRMREKISMAMVIPVITLAVMLIAAGFWMVVVMPSLKGLFDTMEMDVPLITQIFLRSSDIVRAAGLQAALVVFCLIILYIIIKNKSESFCCKADEIYLKLPVLGRLLRCYNFAFIAEYTGLMISAGVPLFRALDILAGALKNTFFIRIVANTRSLMSAGRSFSDALVEQKLFAPMVIRMISVGEQTGRLEEQLEYVSDYYYKKVDYLSENISRVVQPVLMLFLSGFFVFMMLSFLLPVYDMVTMFTR